jgi:hypothetical protein
VAQKKRFCGDPGALIGEAIFGAIKPLYKEGERQRRMSRRRAPRPSYFEPEPKVSQKEVVFEVLPRAIRNAGTNFSRRDLYYATRPLAYAHDEWEGGKTLGYGYFSQGLLTEYQEMRGPIVGLWSDARGHLLEPHTGNSVALGTREVAAYAFPDYTFNKILYVEKEGEVSKLKAAKLAERYDMAIVSGKGYPAEAVRTLFERAEGGDHQLFVLHDADIDGYNIARVMREATRRMPGYSVEVVDIGLTVEDALEMNLDPEPFSRKKGLPGMLYGSLSPVAVEYFTHRHERFELNAILPDTRRVEYIEGKLEENEVRGKVIPPDDALKERCEEMYRKKVGGWVDGAIAELLQVDELKENIAEERQERFGLGGARGWIEEGFERDRSKSWRGALNEKLEELYKAEHEDDLRDAVRRQVRERIAGDEGAL